MISKENEYVPFKTNYKCEGPVEVYLSNLELKMQTTLQELLIDAKETTEEWTDLKPR